jgi:Fe-S oxidoreductase
VGIEKILSKITEKNNKILSESHPKELILCTPEAMTSVTKEKTEVPLVALSDVIFDVLRKKKKLPPLQKTIAVHPACELDNDPFYKSTLELLALIPGVTVVELNGRCGHTKFERLDGTSKQSAIDLMNEAVEHHADMIVCTSPYCEAHLLMSQRKGSWRTVEIDVKDIYQVLYAHLTGASE